MITEKEIKILEKATSRGNVITIKYMLPVVACFLALAAVMNLRSASILAEASEMNLRELIVSWTHGFDLNSNYSGVYCVGIEKLSNSMLNFGMAFFGICIWIIKIKELAWSKRMLNHLQAMKCEPGDADNPCNPPENPKNQLDD